MSDKIWTSDIKTLSNLPKLFEDWLTRPKILTRALQALLGEVKVDVVSESIGPLLPDERSFLEIPDEDSGHIRKIFLTSEQVPMTYGRVVIPNRTYAAEQAQFQNLGDKPLGETLLYGKPDVVRSHFEYAALPPSHPIYREVAAHLEEKPDILYARRSWFALRGHKLLVTECFLSRVPAYS